MRGVRLRINIADRQMAQRPFIVNMRAGAALRRFIQKRGSVQEKQLQNSVLLRLGGRPDVRLFRNNVGTGYTLDGRRIRFGLHVGSGDLIGWRSVVIVPEYIGRTIAVFTSLEIKSKRGMPTARQLNWRDQVVRAGGIAGIVRSIGDAERLIGD